ncbi:hypothetical protein P691DRAFT_739952, partial [Macrolepiota fuliginosa MF-IS2]
MHSSSITAQAYKASESLCFNSLRFSTTGRCGGRRIRPFTSALSISLSWQGGLTSPLKSSVRLLSSDIPALLSLSQINHTLNHLALKRYFKVKEIGSPTLGYIVSGVAAGRPLPALNTALWLDHLPTVVYYLDPDIRWLFDEVRGLTRLVKRVKRNERLELRFMYDWWGRKSELGYGVVTVDAGVWVRIWVGLLEAALKGGCRFLRIDGAHVLNTQYAPCSVPRVVPGVDAAVPSAGAVPRVTRSSRLRSEKCLEAQVSSHPRPAVGSAKITPAPPGASFPPERELSPMPDEGTSFQTSSPCLTTLYLRSSMMLQPLFLPHTINLIRNHSSVLCHLELVSIRANNLVWQEFFPKLMLPALQHFTYTFSMFMGGPLITLQLLLDFFARHPTMREVKLHGVSIRDPFPSIEPTLLPSLRHLDAHPRIVSWLLQHPTSCPSLHFVSLTSEH